MDKLATLDTRLFYKINGAFDNALLDFVSIYLLNKYALATALLVAGAFGVLKGGVGARRVVVLCALAIIASDLSVLALKEAFARVRPCHALDGVRLLVECSDSFSHPSRHTTDTFTAMVLLSMLFARLAPLFIVVALMVAYSRVHVGVHYPADVLAGLLLGTVVALLLYVAELKSHISERILGIIFKSR